MRAGFTISAAAHALVLGCSVMWYSARPLNPSPEDPIVAEVISETEFTQIAAGSAAARQTPQQAPVVDKVGEVQEPPKEPTLKVAKQDVVTPTAPPPAPPEVNPDPVPGLRPPEVKPPETKPAEGTPERRPVEASQPPNQQQPSPPASPPPDPAAEALSREEARRQEEARKLEEARKQEDARRLEEARKREEARRREETRKREEAKKREEVTTDLNRIAKALIDKRAPQRQAVAGTLVNPTAPLGTPTGTAASTSQSEVARLKAMLYQQLAACWNPPVGVREAQDLAVTVRFSLNRDGTLLGEPVVTNRGANPLFQVAAETALRAVRSCQPLRLPASRYDMWHEVEVTFDTTEMFGG